MSGSRSASCALLAILSGLLFLGAGTASAQVAVGVYDGRLLRTMDHELQAVEIGVPVRAERIFAVTGESVLFAAEPAEERAAGDVPPGSNLWRADLDGRNARRLVADGSVLRATWSEAARLLAVVTTDLQIRLLREDGHEWKTLARRGQSPSFSPDGTRLAYAAAPEGWRPGSQPGGFDLRILDLRTGRDRRLTTGYDDAEPIWTPDERALLFLSGGRTGLTSLWKIRLDGTGLRQLTQIGERALTERTFVPNPSSNADAVWSEDGRSLLYGARYTEEGEVIVLTFSDEGRLDAVATLGAGVDPVWKGEGALALRRSRDGAIAVELPLRAARVRKAFDPPALRRPVPSYLPPFGARVARGEEALRPEPADKLLATLFRWPATFYPAPVPTAYFVDQDARPGFIRSNWCDNRTYDGHLGSDIQLACNNSVRGARGGFIDWRNDGCPNVGFPGSTCGGGFGNFVEVNHQNGWFTIYAHMKLGTPAPLGAPGTCGAPVGTSYSSGNSSGCHLHFEVRTYSGGSYFVWDPYNGPCTNAGLWCTNAATQFPGMGCC